MINEGTIFDCHEEDDFDFKILGPSTIPSSESGSQDGSGESTIVACHLISPNIVSNFIQNKSWMDFLHQPVNRSWRSIDVSYVSIIVISFSALYLLIAPMHLRVL